MITDSLEHRRVKELEKRVADLERLVGGLLGYLLTLLRSSSLSEPQFLLLATIIA